MPAIRGSKSTSKTRRRHRDLDQVHNDLADPKHLEAYKNTHAAEDLPALGKHYCTPCAKWFESHDNLMKHSKAKPHKRRIRQLKQDPYTQKEAEAAAGLTTDNGRPEQMSIDDYSNQNPAAALVPSTADFQDQHASHSIIQYAELDDRNKMSAPG